MSEPKFPTCEVVGTLIDFERGFPLRPGHPAPFRYSRLADGTRLAGQGMI